MGHWSDQDYISKVLFQSNTSQIKPKRNIWKSVSEVSLTAGKILLEKLFPVSVLELARDRVHAGKDWLCLIPFLLCLLLLCWICVKLLNQYKKKKLNCPSCHILVYSDTHYSKLKNSKKCYCGTLPQFLFQHGPHGIEVTGIILSYTSINQKNVEKRLYPPKHSAPSAWLLYISSGLSGERFSQFLIHELVLYGIKQNWNKHFNIQLLLSLKAINK